MLNNSDEVLSEPVVRIDKMLFRDLNQINSKIKKNKILTMLAGFIELCVILTLVYSSSEITALNYIIIMLLIALLMTRVFFGMYRDHKLREEKERFKRFILY